MTTDDIGPYVTSAMQYADDVIGGNIVAGKWTILACERQSKDMVRSDEDESWPYEFNVDRAEAICDFIEHMHHVKGAWAKRRERIRLEPWQCFGLAVAFGWEHRIDKTRRFRTSYEEVARKNAKSTKAAGVGLYGLTDDGEEGAEIYAAAVNRDQAKIVFDVAKQMVQRSPELREKFGVEVLAHNINVQSTGSSFVPLHSESGSLEGKNPHIAIIDELHAHKTRAVYDVIETGTGARLQSMMWIITTAGSNRAGICYELRTYLTKILQGLTEDDTFFGIIYSIDDGDDWTDPKVWAKANPNLGVSVYVEDIARQCRKAMEMPSAQNNFVTKRMNVWANADTAWMDMRAWDRAGDPTLDIADFAGEECIGGLDLASKIDIAARASLFRRKIDGVDHYYAFGQYYLPEETIQNGTNSQYEGWEIEGRLIATPGNIIDYSRIEDDLKDSIGKYTIREVAYDPFQATQFSTRMSDEGFEMVEVRPTVLSFSEPMKELEALVISGRFHHDGCPVLAWMVSNVVCHLDNKDNIYPRKERPENKIDGVIAILMALARWLADEHKPSIYESEDVFM